MQLTHLILFNIFFPLIIGFLFSKLLKSENRLPQPISRSILLKLIFVGFVTSCLITVPFYFIEKFFQKNESLCEDKGGVYSRKDGSCTLKDSYEQYMASKISLD